MKKYKLIILIAIVMVVISCDDDSSSNETEINLVAESVALETSIQEAESVADNYVLYGSNYLEFGGVTTRGFRDRSGFFSNCATIESETINDTTTNTITFQDDCENRRGAVVSGSIIIVKIESDTNINRSVSFENFSVNGYAVSGTMDYNFVEENTNGNPEITGTTNLSIDTDEGTITKNGSKTIEITSGGDTDTYTDDEFTYTGINTCSDAEGNIVEVEIIIPLVKPADCNYIAEGTKQYSENSEVSTLDYGDGTCDSTAMHTASDGTITEIELRRGRRNFHR